MKKQMLALAMMAAAGSSVAGGPWVADGTQAMYLTDSGVTVAVGFASDGTGRCPITALSIVGNSDIAEIGLCTDKKCFHRDPVVDQRPLDNGLGFASMIITPSARDALANHNIAEIRTNAGNVTISLKGSNAAMIAAHRTCVQESTQQLGPTLPLRPSQPVEPAESQDQFKVYEGGVMM